MTVPIVKIHYGILGLVNDRVKETDQKILVGLSGKQPLETIVDKGINVTAYKGNLKI